MTMKTDNARGEFTQAELDEADRLLTGPDFDGLPSSAKAHLVRVARGEMQGGDVEPTDDD